MEHLDTFLAGHVPFDALTEAQRLDLSARAVVSAQDTGELVLVEDGPPSPGLWVILGVGEAAGVPDEHAGHGMTVAVELVIPAPGRNQPPVLVVEVKEPFQLNAGQRPEPAVAALIGHHDMRSPTPQRRSTFSP